MQKIRSLRWRLAILFGCVFSSGCAVLTSSQVATVHQFGAVTRSYTGMPAEVIEAHGDLRAERQALAISTLTDGELALQTLDTTQEQFLEFGATADRVGSALTILGTYSDLLARLASEDFSRQAEAAVAEAGKALNDALGLHGGSGAVAVPGAASDSLIGNILQIVVRVFIRGQQEKLIRHYVTEAAPIIDSITEEVEQLLAPYVADSEISQALGGSLIEDELTQLDRQFVAAVNNARGSLSLLVLSHVLETRLRGSQAARLASRSQVIAGQYRQAHQRLVEVVGAKRELEGELPEIQRLSSELAAAHQDLAALHR